MPFMGVDTALQNSGVVIIDNDGSPLFYGKPPFQDGEELEGIRGFERIRAVRAYLHPLISKYNVGFVAFEDYLLTGYAKSYQTAELVSILKDWCFNLKMGFCLVHPLKTKKYVVKKKDVSKTEIITYWRERVPQEWPKSAEYWLKMPRAQQSDCSDAMCIAHIGKLVYEQHFARSPLPFSRWEEIIWTDTSGILTKSGLSYFPSEVNHG